MKISNEVKKIYIQEDYIIHTDLKTCRINIIYILNNKRIQSCIDLTHPFDTKQLAKTLRKLAYRITHD